MKVFTVLSGLFQSQAFVAVDEATGDCAIVDSGEDGRGIPEAVERAGAVPRAILLTHGHIDHAGGLARLRRAFPDVPIFANPADRNLVEHIVAQGLMFGVPVEPAPLLDRFISDGEEIRIGDRLTLRVIFTPGHTPGGTTYFEPTARAAFVGDTLFAGSVGRTDLPGGSFATLLRSIRERLLPLGDDVTCHCGHGPETTIGEERRSNPFLGESAGDEAD